MRLDVEIDRICTHSEYSPEPYGPWEESWYNSFDGVSISKNNWGEPIDFEVSPGDTVYVVWAEYSSGNSFGRGHNNGVDVVGIFKDAAKAEKCRQACEASSEDNSMVKFESDSGEKISYYAPWNGYFESLGSIRLETAVIKE